MLDDTAESAAWEQLERIIDSGESEHLDAFIQLLPPGETAYTISRLSEDYQTRLLSAVRPELGAQLMEHLADVQAADMIEELPPPGGRRHR